MSIPAASVESQILTSKAVEQRGTQETSRATTYDEDMNLFLTSDRRVLNQYHVSVVPDSALRREREMELG